MSFSAVSSAVAAVSPTRASDHAHDFSSYELIALVSLVKDYFSLQPLIPKEIYDALSEAVGIITLLLTMAH